MTFEEALEFVETALESKRGKPLSLLEQEILKACWENATYGAVADSLYLSVGHIKDLASILWQRLSDAMGEKVTKNNFLSLLEKQSGATAMVGAKGKEAPIAPVDTGESDVNPSETPKGNILIVDDLIENLHFLRKVLNKHGYTVRSVTNGKMALRTIHHNLPDVILLDIKMPEMDGYEVCEALKADETTSEVPVIFLSALDEVLDKVKAFKVGGVDYITKPFQAEELIARIQTQLTIQQQKHQLRKQIEAHQETAEILYQSRTLLASLLNSSKDGIAAVQAVREPITEEIHDFRCLVVNPVFAKLFGQKRENLMGTTIKKMFNQLTPTLFDSLVEVVETGEAMEQKFYWEKDDSQILYYLSAVKLGDGCSITVRDITMFKLLEFKVKMEAHLE